jgi:hypothetical protein
LLLKLKRPELQPKKPKQLDRLKRMKPPDLLLKKMLQELPHMKCNKLKKLEFKLS